MAKYNETLCWRCKRPGTGTCSWDKSKATVPVEGWTAEEVPYMSWCETRATTTFHVIDCPLFDPEENYAERRKHNCGEMEDERKGRKNTPRAEIEHLIRNGWTDKAIALRFQRSVDTIRKYRTEWRKKQDNEERKKKK